MRIVGSVFIALISLILISCGGGSAGQQDAGTWDGATGADAEPPGDGSVDADAALEHLSCQLIHLTPYIDNSQDLVRIRVHASEPLGGGEVVITEMDQMSGETLLRTLPMTLTSAPGDWLAPVFGFDGLALSSESGLCQDLPPVEPYYFEMRGTVNGAPAAGRCGSGIGEGHWPPQVRVSCGEWPVVDAAISSVYQYPNAPAPGFTEITVDLRLAGPASGVSITPEVLTGTLEGNVETLSIGSGQPFQLVDIRADNPSTGSTFDGTVPAEGLVVYLQLAGELTLAPDFCATDVTDPFVPLPLIYVQGTGASNQDSFTWTTAAHSCVLPVGDGDYTLP